MQREALTLIPRSPGRPGGPTGPSCPGRPGFPGSPYKFPQLIIDKTTRILCNSIAFKLKMSELYHHKNYFGITYLYRILKNYVRIICHYKSYSELHILIGFKTKTMSELHCSIGFKQIVKFIKFVQNYRNCGRF